MSETSQLNKESLKMSDQNNTATVDATKYGGGQLYIDDSESLQTFHLKPASTISLWHLGREIVTIDMEKNECRFADGIEPGEAAMRGWEAFFNAFPGAVDMVLKFHGAKDGEWQPIETAPKSGVKILVSCGSKRALAAYYKRPAQGHWEKRIFREPRWMQTCPPLDGWFESSGIGVIVNQPLSPTHWMPLPPCPQQCREEGGVEHEPSPDPDSDPGRGGLAGLHART